MVLQLNVINSSASYLETLRDARGSHITCRCLWSVCVCNDAMNEQRASFCEGWDLLCTTQCVKCFETREGKVCPKTKDDYGTTASRTPREVALPGFV